MNLNLIFRKFKWQDNQFEKFFEIAEISSYSKEGEEQCEHKEFVACSDTKLKLI